MNAGLAIMVGDIYEVPLPTGVPGVPDRFQIRDYSVLARTYKVEDLRRGSAMAVSGEFIETICRKTPVQPLEMWSHPAYERPGIIKECLYSAFHEQWFWSIDVGESTLLQFTESYLLEDWKPLRPNSTVQKPTTNGACTGCGADAFLLFQTVECTSSACRHYKR